MVDEMCAYLSDLIDDGEEELFDGGLIWIGLDGVGGLRMVMENYVWCWLMT